MTTNLVFIFIIVLLIALELAYFKVAEHFNIVDKPNERSSHKSIVLRGGGVIFLMGMWIYAALFCFVYPWFLVGVTLVGIVSFFDDVRSLPDSVRLAVQFVSMILMFVQLGLFKSDALNSFGCYGWFMSTIALFIALIVCTGITNAYNFMDGINGVTGGYSFVILLSMVLTNVRESFVDVNLIAVTILSVLVFCFFNFRKKAKCFAGDVGSISIAFILLFMLGRLMLATGHLWYIMFFVVYGVDTVLTIVHRIMLHENLGQAHRKHAYQLMANELGIPHVVVSLIYMMIQLIISLGLIYLPSGISTTFGVSESMVAWIYSLVVCIILVVGYILFMKKCYHLHEKYLNSKKFN